jgi:cytochrome c peroxidase
MKTIYLNILFLVAALLPAIVLAGPNDQINLGKKIYDDKDLSLNLNQSCQSCHHQKAKFSDPENRMMPAHLPVSDGSDNVLFGTRNAPSAAYAGFSPIFHFDGELFVGGVFWDGRASGIEVTATANLGDGPTGDPMADQAKGPFGNPVEMALGAESDPDSTVNAVVSKIESSNYAKEFKKVCGKDIFNDYGKAYNCAANAIAAFERSNQVNKFTSKFDQFLTEQGGDVSQYGTDHDTGLYIGPPVPFTSNVFTFDEADGLAIFNAMAFGPDSAITNGGQCNLCHLTTNHFVDTLNNPVNGPNPVGPNLDGSYNPVFTDFTYDNLGIPLNERIAELHPGAGSDPGLGGQTELLNAAFDAPYVDADNLVGAFKVSSLRNLAATAPYGHNGYFPNMTSIVQFYNTRDLYPCNGTPGEIPATPELLAQGFIPGYPQDAYNTFCWEDPEFPGTMNSDELGNLGLTSAQVDKLVLFMNTLTD